MSTTPSIKTIPTLDEHEAQLERIAVARLLVKNNGNMPNRAAVARELQAMRESTIYGRERFGDPSVENAKSWLLTNGCLLPKD